MKFWQKLLAKKVIRKALRRPSVELAEQIVFDWEKEKYQRTYHWTDEQFQRFWDNPDACSYRERKEELISICCVAIDSVRG